MPQTPEPNDLLSGLLEDAGLQAHFVGSFATTRERGFAFPGTLDAAVHIVLQGNAWVGSESSQRELRRADLALLPSDVPSHVSGCPGASPYGMPAVAPRTVRAHIGRADRHAFQVLTLGFEYRNARSRPLFGALPDTMFLRLPADAIELATHIDALLLAPRLGSEFAAFRLAESLFAQVVALGASSLSSPDSWMPALRDEQLAPVLRAVHTRPTNDWKIGNLARLAGLSPAAFCRRFSAMTGVSPARYVRELRVRKASALLRISGMSVAEVAAAAGYASESSFSRAFVGLTGQRPGAGTDRAYRKSRRG